MATVEIGKSRTKCVVLQLARPPLPVTTPWVLDTTDIDCRNSFSNVLDLFSRMVRDAGEPLEGAALSLGAPIDYAADSYDLVGPRLADPRVWPEKLAALQAAVATAAGLARVTVVNDAVAFAYGVAWSSNAADDTLCLTLGTGVGATTFTRPGPRDQPTSIRPLEVHSFQRHWPCCLSGSPHELAGRPFFSYAQRETDWDLDETSLQFTQRVNWIIQALADAVPFRTVVLGGGRSPWIDPRHLLPDVTVADPDPTSGNVGASAAWYWQHRHASPPHAIVSPPHSLT